MSNEARLPSPFAQADGCLLGLHVSRFDERQRRQQLHLDNNATCWDYAPLIDVIRRQPNSPAFRFTGNTAAQWMADLRKRQAPEYAPFTKWYESVVSHHLRALARRPRVPDNHYCVEVAVPPLEPSLPRLIRHLGLTRASVEQWSATLRSLTGKGLKTEELEMSGVLARLQCTPAGEMPTQAQVLQMIDLAHVTPKFACESRFGFATTAGWKELCQSIPEKDFKRRGLLGTGYGAQYVIRYRHRSLGWAIARSRYGDLITERSEWWSVLDERGRFIPQSVPGFSSPEDAMIFAERQMSQRFISWGKDQALSKWQRFSLPGGDGYREILLQLVLLCHKVNLTFPQQGQRGSLPVIARAMSTRSVEIESGTWRWTRPAAAREVTFG